VDGVVIAEASSASVTEEGVRAALLPLTGTVTMSPPAHSAVRVNGKRLYELARAGKTVQAPERTVEISKLTLLTFTPGPRARLLADVTCSKGTYIRSLALMLGESLGCGAHLSILIRTAVGDHRLDQAVTFEELAQNPSPCLLTARQALPHLPEVLVDSTQSEAMRHGQSVPADADLPPGPVLVYNAPDVLLCLAEVASSPPVMLQPRKGFATG
ncbi:MAG: pseudouridine synthase, partial [Armatimonadota bacterium]